MLITLGIIGVVAAMTIPTLSSKIQWVSLHSQYKRANSVSSNIMRLMQSNEEIPACYYISPSSVTSIVANQCYEFWLSFSKNAKIAQVCEGNAFEEGCIPPYKGVEEVKNLKEEDMEDFNKTCNGYSKNHIYNNTRIFVLLDGMIFIPYASGTWYAPQVLIDINGKNGPNKWGYDLFPFSVSQNTITGSTDLKPSTTSCFAPEEGGKTVKQMLGRTK